jgi:HEXXH motif-containing protein
MQLSEQIEDLIAKGQGYLSEAIKLLIYQKAPEIFERLDFNDDYIFREPFLFAYFNNKTNQIPLEQILYGYMEEGSRPEELKVYAENQGVIFLPQIGYFIVPVNQQYLLLRYDNKKYHLYHQGVEVPYTFEPLLFIPGTPFEVHRYNSIVFHDYFKVWNDEKKDFEDPDDVEITRTTELHLSKIARAMQILREHCPQQYEHYLQTTRRYVIFSNPRIRNFAVRDLHGTAFLSARPEHTEIFFMEEIIHQSSHNVFNAVTAKLPDHFRIDPETPLKNFSNREGEFRSIYSAHHGLYTVTTRLICFDECVDVFEGETRYEIAARLADLRRRFRNGMEKMNFEAVFTPLGYEVYDELDRCCAELFTKRNYLIGRFDFSNQKAGFNFNIFLAQNSVQQIEEILQPLTQKA